MTDPNGLDVIDHATALITAAMHQAISVQATRWRDGPDACPDYGPDLSTKAIATRAVGELLAAGLLVTPLTPDELAEMRRQNQRTRGGT